MTVTVCSDLQFPHEKVEIALPHVRVWDVPGTGEALSGDVAQLLKEAGLAVELLHWGAKGNRARSIERLPS
jgi:hypothetical protein